MPTRKPTKAPAGLQAPPKRMGRPPLPPELRSEPTRPYSIRLTDAEIAKLQRIGIRRLRDWLDRVKESPAGS